MDRKPMWKGEVRYGQGKQVIEAETEIYIVAVFEMHLTCYLIAFKSSLISACTKC